MINEFSKRKAVCSTQQSSYDLGSQQREDATFIYKDSALQSLGDCELCKLNIILETEKKRCMEI